ncbi:MAG TPA: M28 family peptidase, partial [Gemmataceae bacterium]|nr:M28 family peptidase [Gemmataceae bacterium]
ISGSDGMTKQQEMLAKHFTKLGGKVERQQFTARQRSQRGQVAMANLIVRWHPERQRRIILCSHYDTRPIADQEPDERKWREPFVSANDGGSGVALLMELAHHVKDLKTAVGVDFVFFDGEEYIHQKNDEYFFGSRHFAADYRRAKPKFTYTAAVLLDMIGGKNAQFPIEANSWWNAAPLVMELWETAAEQKCAAFQKREGPQVDDDHLALNRAGIPAVDIIDFSYRHWHRLSDVPQNCSGESLEQVARVLSVWLQRAK